MGEERGVKETEEGLCFYWCVINVIAAYEMVHGGTLQQLCCTLLDAIKPSKLQLESLFLAGGTSRRIDAMIILSCLQAMHIIESTFALPLLFVSLPQLRFTALYAGMATEVQKITSLQSEFLICDN